MEPTTTTPEQTNEAAALSALADLVFQPLAERASKLERKEQLRQAMKEYLEAEPNNANPMDTRPG